MIALLSTLLLCCSAPEPQTGPLVFMSFSVPLPSWQDHSAALEKSGGKFVLRGLPENSFPLFAQKVLELREAGVNAPIEIDPDAFEEYQIEAVPVFVFKNGSKIVGNIPFEDALRRSNEKNCS